MEHRSAIGSEPFQKSLHSLGKEAKDALIDVIYNKSAPVSWEMARLSEPTDAYHWEMPRPEKPPTSITAVGFLRSRISSLVGGLVGSAVRIWSSRLSRAKTPT